MKDHRPISLINGIVKIFTKTLANRLLKYINSLISESQFTFIRGRQIADCYSTAMEIISHYSKSKQKGILLKLDFKKASDKINRNFLFELMKARGFGEGWCNWVKDLLCSSKLAPVVNGKPSNWILAKQGLK